MINCPHCGQPLLDGSVDWYCPNQECNLKEMRIVYQQMQEQKERIEYERLKAKYETVHCNT